MGNKRETVLFFSTIEAQNYTWKCFFRKRQLFATIGQVWSSAPSSPFIIIDEHFRRYRRITHVSPCEYGEKSSWEDKQRETVRKRMTAQQSTRLAAIDRDNDNQFDRLHRFIGFLKIPSYILPFRIWPVSFKILFWKLPSKTGDGVFGRVVRYSSVPGEDERTPPRRFDNSLAGPVKQFREGWPSQ